MADKTTTSNQKDIFSQFQHAKQTEERLTNYMAALNEKRRYAQEWMEQNLSGIAATFHLFKNAADTSTPQEWADKIKSNDPMQQVAFYIPVDGSGKKLATYLMEKAENAPEIQEKLQQVSLGIPRDIFDHIDEAYNLNDQKQKPEGPANTDFSGKDISNTDTDDTDFEEKKYGFWDRVTGKDKDDTAKLQNDLQQAQKRLLAVQTDQPYYIDAFFDWVEDSALVTKSAKYQQSENVQNADIQDSYKDPSYMLRLAQADLDETIDIYTECANDMARDYHRLVTAFEGTDIHHIISVVSDIKENSSNADRLFKLAMSGAVQKDNTPHASYIDWAFKNFDDPKQQAFLLSELQKTGEDAKFTDFESDQEKFKMIFDKVLDTKNPMPVSAINDILADIHHANEWSAENMIDFITHIEPSPLQETVKTFRQDKEQMADVLNALLNPLNEESHNPADIANTSDIVEAYKNLLIAADDGDLKALYRALPTTQTLNEKRIAKQMMVLAYAVDPDFNLADMITEKFGEHLLGEHNLVNLWANSLAYGSGLPTATAGQDKATSISHKMVDIAYANAYQLSNVAQAMRNVQAFIIQKEGAEKWQDILTNTSGKAEIGLIEKISTFSKDNPKDMANMLHIMLSPINDNAARHDILSTALQHMASDDHAMLQEFTQALAGYFPNFQGKTILNPDHAQNIWASNEGVFYNSHGSSHKIAADLKPSDSLNYIQTITDNHADYQIFGDELIKPEEISFAWVESSNTSTSFNYYFAGATSQITVETEQEAQEFIQKLTAENDNILELEDHYSIMMNKGQALHITYRDGSMYQLLQYHNQAGNGEAIYLETECDQDDAQAFLNNLAQDEHLFNANGDIINLDQITMCWYDDEAESLQYIMKGIAFYTDPNGDVLKNSPFPGIQMSQNTAHEMLSAFIERSDDHMHINGVFLNASLINSMTYDPVQQEMLIQTAQRDIKNPIDPDLAEMIFDQLNRRDDFTAATSDTGDKAIINKNVVSYIFHDDVQTQNALISGRLFSLEQEMDIQGTNWVQPDLVDAAFNMNNIDEISLQAGTQKTSPALVIKTHGITNEIALEEYAHGQSILADITRKGREKITASADILQNVEKLDLNITPALTEAKASPVEYGVLSASTLFNQKSIKANDNIRSLFQQQAHSFKERAQKQAEADKKKALSPKHKILINKF